MRLKTTELKRWRLDTLETQGFRCALCGDHLPAAQACADHCHKTGHLRGVIHRACNSVLGKVERGTRYGRDFDPAAFALGLHEYLTRNRQYPLHPSHGRAKTKRRKISYK
jgi:hypothetical protein